MPSTASLGHGERPTCASMTSSAAPSRHVWSATRPTSTSLFVVGTQASQAKGAVGEFLMVQVAGKANVQAKIPTLATKGRDLDRRHGQ